jgi:hypothetical protein
MHWVQLNKFQSVDTGCIESIPIDATGCDRSSLGPGFDSQHIRITPIPFQMIEKDDSL